MSKLIYQGRIVRVTREQVRLPNGETFTLERVWHPGGAAVVAVDDQGRICLLRQYRHVAGGWLWELPAGKRDGDETAACTASRELREEAGRTAARWTDLGTIYSSPGVFDERIHLFLAEGLQDVATAHESHEQIEVHWIALGQALAWAADGTICDAKSVIGLFRAATYLSQSGASK